MLFSNYPYKIKDVAYNPNKKELMIALHNGTIQIYSHFKNFAECVIYENIKLVKIQTEALDNELQQKKEFMNNIYSSSSKINSVKLSFF